MSELVDCRDHQRKAGLLLVGHGSRERLGLDEFLMTAQLIAQATTWGAVEPCFLEFARPTIAEGVENVARRGARPVVVAPAMLFAAGHVRRDVPAAVAQAAAGYPGLPVVAAEHLGCHEAIVALSKLRFDECLTGKPHVPAEDTVLVLVGRGSDDVDAIDELFRFARLRHAQGSAAQVRVGFVAMAAPPLERVLDEVARLRPRRIVVEPHLLFGGVLTDRIGAIVAQRAREHGQSQWLVTGHLGPAELLVRAIDQRAAAALAGADRRNA